MRSATSWAVWSTGPKYILNDKTIVTCTEVKQLPLRGRAMRRRERAVKQYWEGEE